jgi:crossover junction endodeoxyribonuclease RuvC
MPNSNLTILGIDPGIKKIGYGVIKFSKNCFNYQTAGIFDIKLSLQKQLENLVNNYRPQLIGIEKIYFGVNKTSALKVSEIKGVIKNTFSDLKIIELAPTQVKLIICGYGRADKQAIKKMVKNSLDLPKNLKSKDGIDALAIALAAFYIKRLDK